MLSNLPSMGKFLEESAVKANIFSIDEMIKNHKTQYDNL